MIGCNETNFPIQYLGMPLTLKRPTKQLFLPLIEKVERRLAGWQSKLLSRGGRLVLVQSVLSTIPIYFMICFKLPKWVLNRIDKGRRLFLWGRSSRLGRGISLCNWGTVCLPKKWGGLGLSDLYLRNISLLLRWWWKGYKEPQSMWTLLITRISWQGIFVSGPKLWSQQGSFFWGDLISIKHLFDWSTTWIIGDGSAISYWYDHWGGKPLKSVGSRCINSAWSLQKACEQLDISIDLCVDQSDELTWRWAASGSYTAKSAYHILIQGGLVRWQFWCTWCYYIPPTVKLFLFLLLKDKLLTREVLQRRSFNCPDIFCPMCDSGAVETSLHLFFQCQHSLRIWNMVEYLLNLTILAPGSSVEQVWRNSSMLLRHSTPLKKKWEVIFNSVCWMIWRDRNSLVFESKKTPIDVVAQWIVRQATLWESFV